MIIDTVKPINCNYRKLLLGFLIDVLIYCFLFVQLLQLPKQLLFARHQMKKLLIVIFFAFLALQSIEAFKKGEKGKSKPKVETPRPPPSGDLKVEVKVRFIQFSNFIS